MAFALKIFDTAAVALAALSGFGLVGGPPPARVVLAV
jgi:hypothetical protein